MTFGVDTTLFFRHFERIDRNGYLTTVPDEHVCYEGVLELQDEKGKNYCCGKLEDESINASGSTEAF